MKWIGKLLVLVLTPSTGSALTEEIVVYDPFKKEELEEREINDSLVFHLRYAASEKQKEFMKTNQQQTLQPTETPPGAKEKKVLLFCQDFLA